MIIAVVLLILAGVAVCWLGQLVTLIRYWPAWGDLAELRERRGDDLCMLAGVLVLAGFSGFAYQWLLAGAFLGAGVIVAACAVLRHYLIRRKVKS